MDVSVNWLRALVPALGDETPEVLADRLTRTAVAVEKVTPVGRSLDDLRVAKVLSVEEHPDADRLTLCRVETGSGEPVPVVCGAPNVRSGGLYPYVPPGGRLPDGTEVDAREIRGVASQGMLCSERELGLGPDHGGILSLPPDLEAGEELSRALDLPDHRLELDLTPNRPDLACHVGVARELAPGGVSGVLLPEFGGPTWDPGWHDGAERAEIDGMSVSVEDPERCSRYLGAVVRGVEVGPSPSWLASRLRSAGVRPVNNVVDATNYVLHELNQPLHAFDLDRIAGGEIRVRPAAAGEELRTLDGVERTLDPVQTVIADARGPVALAGIMGGEDTEVTDRTSGVFLECAIFDPSATRSGARHTGLSTEASYRFERGVDPTACEEALARCVDLILAVAGGRPEPAGLRLGGPPGPAPELTLRPSRVEQVLGRAFSRGELADLLQPLGFRCEIPEASGGEEGTLRVAVPGWRRGDVAREIDLVEEVARREGFDAFPARQPSFRPSAVPADPAWSRAARARRRLTARGLLETRSIPFVAAGSAGDGGVRLRNPLAEDRGTLRSSLLPVLLRAVERNFSHGERSVRLFEIGSVFRADPDGPLPVEELRIGAVLTGLRRPEHWSREARPVDFWDLKGLASEIATEWCGGRLAAASDPPGVDGGDVPLEAEVLGPERFWILQEDRRVGVAGRVRPNAVEAPDWADPAWGLELRLAAVGERSRTTYREVSSFPPLSRDLAVVAGREVAAETMEETIRRAAPGTLESLRLFDVFEGEKVGPDRRSLAWRFTFRAPDRTLRDQEIDEAMSRIAGALEDELDASIRTD